MTKSKERVVIDDLSVVLGKDEFGSNVTIEISKLPYLLVSGITGTGKSTLIHNILTSLLLKNSPERLKLLLADFKQVDLPLYETVPHLLAQVILEPKKAILALKWLQKEADRRQALLKDARTTNIEEYHKEISEVKDSRDPMPYILCIVDEFSDAMMSYPREFEDAILRLTQVSRVVGISLIISTSRPSNKVITAAIKANIPTRAVFQVDSPTDSRWLLGIAGAETSRSTGRMLFRKSGMTFPIDIQTLLISESEVKKSIKEIRNKYGSASFIEYTQTMSDDDSSDELYEQAQEIVIEAGKASTSFLQRKLQIGYARAARLVDMLEERGVIGDGSGAKPREVLNKKRRPK